MLYALLRFLAFEIPAVVLKGTALILFEKEEIINLTFLCRRRRSPINKKAILAHYLEECRKQVWQEDNNGKSNKKK